MRPVLCATVLVLLLAGCAEDRSKAPAPALRADAYVTATEARAELGARTAAGWKRIGRSPLAKRVKPRPVGSMRLSLPAGVTIHLLEFKTVRLAREAQPSVLRTALVKEGGATQRAGNLIAVFPRRPLEGMSFAAWSVLREIGDACADPDDAPRDLRRVCFYDLS